MLSESDFKALIASGPLVSVDLIITDSSGNLLMGKRNHSPAKDTWCVPGGRIFKNETIAQAVSRKLKDEIGIDEIPPMNFLGVYEHFYPASAFDPSIPTHYIALGFQFQIEHSKMIHRSHQHDDLHFISRAEALNRPDVPEFIKNYLRGNFTDYLGWTIFTSRSAT